MDGFSQTLNQTMQRIVEQLCDDILAMKKEYFTPQGKQGWQPLAPSTIRTKKYRYPDVYNHFNVATGKLKNNLHVFYELTDTGIKITFEAKDDALLLKRLTETLGRDFVTFDDKEKEFIKKRFKELVIEHVK